MESHVSPFLEKRVEGVGLGFLSEQAMEAAHHDFKTEWENNKVAFDHKDIGEKLLKTVVRYNSKHI